jgi:hypothetical protein
VSLGKNTILLAALLARKSSLPLEQHAGHARATRKLIAPLQLFERESPARKFDPSRRLHESYSSRRIVKCFLLDAGCKVRQIQGHRRLVQVSPGEGTAS